MADSQRGRKLSEETKEKIRQKALGHKRNVGRPITERAKELIRQKALGRKHSEATKQKLRADRIGIPVPEHIREKMRKAKQALIECPHCHKIGMAGGMLSRHFDQCKLKE